jgi:hypothetical protein
VRFFTDNLNQKKFSGRKFDEILITAGSGGGS